MMLMTGATTFPWQLSKNNNIKAIIYMAPATLSSSVVVHSQTGWLSQAWGQCLAQNYDAHTVTRKSLDLQRIVSGNRVWTIFLSGIITRYLPSSKKVYSIQKDQVHMPANASGVVSRTKPKEYRMGGTVVATECALVKLFILLNM
jgi:hypothetical protein